MKTMKKEEVKKGLFVSIEVKGGYLFGTLSGRVKTDKAGESFVEVENIVDQTARPLAASIMPNAKQIVVMHTPRNNNHLEASSFSYS